MELDEMMRMLTRCGDCEGQHDHTQCTYDWDALLRYLAQQEKRLATLEDEAPR